MLSLENNFEGIHVDPLKIATERVELSWISGRKYTPGNWRNGYQKWCFGTSISFRIWLCSANLFSILAVYYVSIVFFLALFFAISYVPSSYICWTPGTLTSFNKNMHQPNSKKRFLYTHYKDSPRGKGLLDDHPQQGRRVHHDRPWGLHLSLKVLDFVIVKVKDLFETNHPGDSTQRRGKSTVGICFWVPEKTQFKLGFKMCFGRCGGGNIFFWIFCSSAGMFEIECISWYPPKTLWRNLFEIHTSWTVGTGNLTLRPLKKDISKRKGSRLPSTIFQAYVNLTFWGCNY